MARRARCCRRCDCPAEHQLQQFFFARLVPLEQAHDAALPHDGNPVSAREDFPQFVADQHDAVALGPQLGDRFEQALAFLGRQYLGRLVEDQHAGIGEELLEDFHLLLIADRKLAYRQPWIDLEPEPISVTPHPRKDFGAARHQSADGAGTRRYFRTRSAPVSA